MRQYILGFLSCLVLLLGTAAVRQVFVPASAEVVSAQGAELDATHAYLAAVRDGKSKAQQDASWAAYGAAKDARKAKETKPK